MKQLLIPFPSVTYAEKGLSVLSTHGYRARIVRLDARLTRKGCAFGLELSGDYDTAIVADILRSSHIRFSEIRVDRRDGYR